jgi:hypothetical protein
VSGDGIVILAAGTAHKVQDGRLTEEGVDVSDLLSFGEATVSGEIEPSEAEAVDDEPRFDHPVKVVVPIVDESGERLAKLTLDTVLQLRESSLDRAQDPREVTPVAFSSSVRLSAGKDAIELAVQFDVNGLMASGKPEFESEPLTLKVGAGR